MEQLEPPAAHPQPLRVLVVAPYPTLRAGLRAVISAEPGFALAGEADSSDALLRQVESAAPQAILLDPGDDVSHWLAVLPDMIPHLPPALLLMASTDLGDQALQAGLRGLLLRDATPEEITAGVRALATGLVALDPRIVDVLAEHLPPPRQALSEFDAVVLSAREREVLNLIAQGLPNKAIAISLGISEHTVKFHVGSILDKLGAASRAEALARAARLGLISL